MTYKSVIATAGVPTTNGLTYPIDVLEKIVEEFKTSNSPLLGYPVGQEVNFKNLIFITKRLEIENETLSLVWKPLDTKIGRNVVHHMKNQPEKVVIFLNGTGLGDENKVIRELNLTHTTLGILS